MAGRNITGEELMQSIGDAAAFMWLANRLRQMPEDMRKAAIAKLDEMSQPRRAVKGNKG